MKLTFTSPSSMIRNEWSCISTPPYTFMKCKVTTVPLPSEELKTYCWFLPLLANLLTEPGKEMMPQNLYGHIL